MAKAVFQEEQKFAKYEVFGLLSFFIIAITIKLAYMFIAQNKFTYDSFSLITAVTLLVGLITAFIYFYKTRLETRITKKSIKFRYYPNQAKMKKIRLDEIADTKEINTPLASELSGWTIHFAGEEETYCPSRHKGVLLKLKDGRHVFLGSKNPNQMANVIRRQKAEISRTDI